MVTSFVNIVIGFLFILSPHLEPKIW